MVRVVFCVLVVTAMIMLSCQTDRLATSPQSSDPAAERVLQRPIEDFIAAQGTTSIWQPYGDEIAWSANPNQYAVPNAGWMDWLGFANAYFVANGGPDLGTQITGNVTERPIEGGRKVHVTLHGTNVMAWAFSDWVNNPNGYTDGPLTFGAFEQDVLTSATPAIGDCNFGWTFTDTYPVGSDLPDLVFTFNVGPWQDPPVIWPYMEWASQLTFNGDAYGPLHEESGWPEGTSGYMHISQVAHLASPTHNPNFDGFPVENVTVGALDN